MLNTVIFDLDDTLYNEIDYCNSGFAAVASYISKNLTTIDSTTIYKSLLAEFATSRTNVFNRTLENLNIAYDAAVIACLVKTYREHRPNITLPADSLNTLKTLKKTYKLALLTDGFMPAQRLKVDALNIVSYFECIVYSEELGREFWKPSTKGFEIILEKLNTAPKNAVYIADNAEKDFLAPNKLAMPSIQLKTSSQLHTSTAITPDYKATYITTSITLLPEILKKL